MKKSSRRKLQKLTHLRDNFYRLRGISVPSDVRAFRKAVDKVVLKHGHYRKRPRRAERIVRRLLLRYRLFETSSETYWRLWAMCALLGPAPVRKPQPVAKPKHKKLTKRKSKS